MWLGIIIGLLLGGAFKSFQVAMVLAVIGAGIGAVVSRQGAPAGDDDLSPAELRRQLRSVQEQLRQALLRIAHIEKYLQETTTNPPVAAAAETPVPGTPAPSSVVEPAEEKAPQATPPLRFDDDDLLRQALAAGTAGAASAAGDAPPTAGVAAWPNLPMVELPPPVPVSAAEVAAPRPTAAAAESASPPAAVADSMAAAAERGERSAYRRGQPPAPVAPTWFSEFVARWVIGGNPIVKVGVLVLFLGFAFLLRYVDRKSVV